MNPQPLRYAISDRNFARHHGFMPPEMQARLLGEEGIAFFQLREKDLPPFELATLTRKVLHALGPTKTRLLINGRADVAAATGAHGVHLTSSPDELTIRQVHRLYAAAGHPAPLVTVSCHTLEDVVRVRREPPTAILFGPVFGKSVRGELVMAGSGLALLRDACQIASPVPVLALGGVTDGNAAGCLQAGAVGFAGIRLFQRRSA